MDGVYGKGENFQLKFHAPQASANFMSVPRHRLQPTSGPADFVWEEENARSNEALNAHSSLFFTAGEKRDDDYGINGDDYTSRYSDLMGPRFFLEPEVQVIFRDITRHYTANIEDDLECDLVLLDEINEQTATAKLCERYKQDKIYTYIGPVLIAVNPYKEIVVDGWRGEDGVVKEQSTIYGPEVVQAYSHRSIHEVQPHPFAVAEDAYHHMCEYGTSNCIIVTGESGAGKTETAKQIMKYVSDVCVAKVQFKPSAGGIIPKSFRKMSAAQTPPSAAAHSHNQSIAASRHVRNILLHSNPLLESFGNAQTQRNNNSSRFGKYMVLQVGYTLFVGLRLLLLS
jgi:hypothetical protein